jgi:hypothetical protein
MTSAETAILVAVLTVGASTSAALVAAFIRLGRNHQKLEDLVDRVERLERLINGGLERAIWSPRRRSRETGHP